MNPKTERKPGEHLEEFQRGIRVALFYKTTRAMVNFSYLPDAERAYLCGWNIGVVQNVGASSLSPLPVIPAGMPESSIHGRQTGTPETAHG